MRVELEHLALDGCLGEAVGHLAVADAQHVRLCAKLFGGRPSQLAFVVGGTVEADRERPDGTISVVGGKREDGRRVDAAAHQAADRNVSAESEANRLVEQRAHLLDLVGLRSPRGSGRSGIGARWIGDVPISLEPDTVGVRDQEMRGRDLANPPEQRARRIKSEVEGVVNGLLVPGGWHAGREQSLDLRREVEDPVELGVEEGLDPETIPGGEERPARVVPQDECKLSAQPLEARRAVLLVKVYSDLAVGPGPEAVSSCEELMTDRLVAVELAVDDDADPLVLGRKWLVGRGVDETQARVPERDPGVG